MALCRFIALSALTLAPAAGCSPGERPSPEAAIASATAAGVAIEFRTEGEPANAGEEIGGVLTPGDAVRRALLHSPTIQSALARVRMAEAEADQAWLLPNPILTVSMRYPASGGRPMVETMLMQDLFQLVQRPGMVEAADKKLRAEAARAVSTALDVAAEVQEAYITAQALDALLQELDGRIATVDRIRDLTQSMVSVGAGTVLDVTSTEEKQVELETLRGERRIEAKEARLTLARLIGEPSSDTGWTLSPWRPESPPSDGDAGWVATALENRPEIQEKRWELAALGTERGLLWTAPFGETQVGADSEKDDGMWAVGPRVMLPLPLLDWGQARRGKADAAVSEASHELTQAERTVIEEVRRAHAVFTATLPLAESIRTQLVPLAELRLNQAEAQLTAGDAGLSDILLAEQDLRSARMRLIEMDQKGALALIRLERAVGGRGIASGLRAGQAAPTTPGALQASSPGQ